MFVDAVEDGRARLMLGDDAFTVPAALLPDGAGEGSWLKLSATVTPPQVDPDVLRRKLGQRRSGRTDQAVSAADHFAPHRRISTMTAPARSTLRRP